MDDYAGRVLADRYRLPLPPSDEYELAQTRAFDTYSGQEVLVRQVPLPEVVEAEVLDADGLPEGFTGGAAWAGARRGGARGMPTGATRTPSDPAVRRAIEAAQAAAQIPDHPRLDQVFDVFAEGGSLWIVSEAIAAQPIAGLLAEAPLTPYRAAEVAADVLTALRALHAHGWVHRNITTRTVLICEDGRVLLTGLAAGAAEEALCGYDPTPDPTGAPPLTPAGELPHAPGEALEEADPGAYPGSPATPTRPWEVPRGSGGPPGGAPEAASGALAPPDGAHTPWASPAPEAPRAHASGTPHTTDARAARAGAIAAYRAGAKAAARLQQDQRSGASGLLPSPGGTTDALGSGGVPPARQDSDAQPPGPPGQIADPYGVRSARPPQPAQDHEASSEGQSIPGDHAEVERSAYGGAPAESAAWSEAAGWGAVGAEETGWSAGGSEGRRGPVTALAAERARQARMAVVGPITERWAPEQAGPVHGNWQLAPPVGPATDLWALGALLFRTVQGHAPYPEDSISELVEMVCSEPPAFAEECGPLRPVVESLLRQDPTERPDFEELRGWLRSLIRSAPEPDAGTHVVATPPADMEGTPIVRHRGELVRRRKGTVATTRHGRHKAGRDGPRRLGRTLLVAVLLGLAAAVAYAMLFMPKAGPSDQQASAAGTGGAGPAPGRSADTGAHGGSPGQGTTSGGPDQTPGSDQPQTTETRLPDGFALRKDSERFQIAVAKDWQRQPKNGLGQVVYSKDGFQLIVVPGRDAAKDQGGDPMVYQREKEHELQPFRDSTWSTSSGMLTSRVGDRVMAEGQFTWQDDTGHELYVRNMALLVAGRYHVVQVRGPSSQRKMVDSLYVQASSTYQYTG